MSVLVLAEHDNASIKDATRVAVTAATKLGGDVHVLVAGQGAQGAADAAAKIAGVAKVLLADDAAYANGLAENVAPLTEAVRANYAALAPPATTSAKNIAPRVAAKLDSQQISEITGIVDANTFERPIYAGNAIATVQSGDAKKVITVRGTAFEKAGDGGSASIETITGASDAGLSSFVGAEIAKLERPELTAAKIIVSGGRALKDSETFQQVIFPLSDKLGAAVGASRTAVDADFVPYYYQVGLNKDEDAPIFQVADLGLVGDLFQIVPELTQKV